MFLYKLNIGVPHQNIGQPLEIGNAITMKHGKVVCYRVPSVREVIHVECVL